MDSRKHADLHQRTKDFGLRVIRMWKHLPHTTVAEVIGKQLLRCATSVAANYRAASIAKSDADFFHKVKICQEKAEILPESRLAPLLDEARQLAAIMTASAITIKKRLNSENRANK